MDINSTDSLFYPKFNCTKKVSFFKYVLCLNFITYNLARKIKITYKQQLTLFN